MRRIRPAARPKGARQGKGQALVEFSLAILIFLVLLMGIFDLGRGIYMYNGVSQAAREIARRTSVYPGISLGQSSETVKTVAIQRGLVPGMADPVYACLTVTGAASPNAPCTSDDFVRVTVGATYQPISLLGFLGDIPLTASSSIQVP